uniref:Uncharacterized protein n=1 Tax=Anguilla anguilla TaxID=7936 RepID=A0A0E9S431_ANGAN
MMLEKDTVPVVTSMYFRIPKYM